jgi:hypothetical protein
MAIEKPFCDRLVLLEDTVIALPFIVEAAMHHLQAGNLAA